MTVGEGSWSRRGIHGGTTEASPSGAYCTDDMGGWDRVSLRLPGRQSCRCCAVVVTGSSHGKRRRTPGSGSAGTASPSSPPASG